MLAGDYYFVRIPEKSLAMNSSVCYSEQVAARKRPLRVRTRGKRNRVARSSVTQNLQSLPGGDKVISKVKQGTVTKLGPGHRIKRIRTFL